MNIMKKRNILLILGVVILSFVIFMIRNWTMIIEHEPLRIFERMSIVKNKLIIETSPNIDKKKLSLSFIKQPDDLRYPVYDTIPLYVGGNIINQIPDEYGKNRFILKYNNNVIYKKIGLWKFKAWYKHDYNIHLYAIDSTVIIKWEIQNMWGTDEMYSGQDTIRIR